MFGLGIPELILVLVIIVFFFGSSRLPSLGKSLGEAIRGFRKSIAGAPAETESNTPKTK